MEIAWKFPSDFQGIPWKSFGNFQAISNVYSGKIQKNICVTFSFQASVYMLCTNSGSNIHRAMEANYGSNMPCTSLSGCCWPPQDATATTTTQVLALAGLFMVLRVSSLLFSLCISRIDSFQEHLNLVCTNTWSWQVKIYRHQ